MRNPVGEKDPKRRQKSQETAFAPTVRPIFFIPDLVINQTPANSTQETKWLLWTETSLGWVDSTSQPTSQLSNTSILDQSTSISTQPSSPLKALLQLFRCISISTYQYRNPFKPGQGLPSPVPYNILISDFLVPIHNLCPPYTECSPAPIHSFIHHLQQDLCI